MFNFLIFPEFIKHTGPLPDAKLFYSTDYLINYSADLGRSEKSNSVLLHLSADLVYPVLYSLLLGSLMVKTGGNGTILLLPPAAMFADFMENFSIAAVLYTEPGTVMNHAASGTGAFFTLFKWSVIIVNILVIIRLFKGRKYAES